MARQKDAGGGMADLLAALFDEAPVGIARLDRDGGIVRCNSRLAVLLGHQPETIVGRAFAEAFSVGDREPVRARLAELAAGSGRRVTVDNVRLLPVQTGEAMRAVHLVATAIAGDGPPCGLLVHVLDGGKRDRQEPLSNPAQKLQVLGQLAGGIAHDFNNLVAAILGSCELALGEIHPGAAGHDDLVSARATALRARGLVRQLLALVRGQPLQPVPLHPDRAIDELLPLLRRLVGRGITLDVQHAAALPPVRIDPGQFDQVIINLAVNARDAMPRGGRLSLRTAVVAAAASAGGGDVAVPPAEPCVLVDVADTGSGIPPEIIGEIFAPLFTTKPAGQGVGLGLATVHDIVERSGGRIEVDSSEGIGTTFRLLLPAAPCAAGPSAEPPAPPAAPPPAAPPPQQPSVAPHREARLLLVEDEAVIRSFAARALRRRGWWVAEAGDGSSAVHALHEPAQPFDLLLIDLKLPDMAGTEVIRQARLQHPDLPVVVISGELSASEALDPADHGVSLLAKPFTLAELVARVQWLLER